MVPWVSNVPFFLGRAQKKIYVPFLHNKDLFYFSPFRGYIRDSLYSMIAWHKHQLKGLNLEWLKYIWSVHSLIHWSLLGSRVSVAILAVLGDYWGASRVQGAHLHSHACVSKLDVANYPIQSSRLKKIIEGNGSWSSGVILQSRSFHWGTFWLLDLFKFFWVGHRHRS